MVSEIILFQGLGINDFSIKSNNAVISWQPLMFVISYHRALPIKKRESWSWVFHPFRALLSWLISVSDDLFWALSLSKCEGGGENYFQKMNTFLKLNKLFNWMWFLAYLINYDYFNLYLLFNSSLSYWRRWLKKKRIYIFYFIIFYTIYFNLW